jgi:hypothetical protein
MLKFDWKILTVGAVAASLGLAACGVQTSLNEAVTSLSASPYLQVRFTATASGSGSGNTRVQQALTRLSFDVLESSTSGSSLSQSVGKINSEIKVNVGSQSLVDLRDVGSNLYVFVDATALAKIPGVDLSPQELSSLQLAYGGRWFELPGSLLNSYLPTTTKSKTQSAKDQAAVQQIIKSVTSVIEATKYTTLPNGGYSETGSLASIAKAILPTIDKLSGDQVHHGAVPGSYKIGVTMSGATATGGSIQITAPNGTAGNETIGLDATVTHASDSIVAPTGATLITSALLKGLLGQVPGTTSTATATTTTLLS